MVDFLGGFELLLLIIVGLLLFGPKKIVEMARWLGRATAEFRRAMSELPDTSPRTRDGSILDAASRIGIDLKGKTVDRVVDDMLDFLEDFKQLRKDLNPGTTGPADGARKSSGEKSE